MNYYYILKHLSQQLQHNSKENFDRKTFKTTRAPHVLSFNIERLWRQCLLWTLSPVMSHPRLRIITNVKTARICFLTCKQIINALVERWQRYLTGRGLCPRTVFFVVMTENSYYSNRYFISVLKTKTCDLNINTNCV